MLETPQQRLEEIKTKMKSKFLLYKSHAKSSESSEVPLGFQRSYLELDLYLQEFHKNGNKKKV